jgi:hypothetical protein
MRLDGQFTEGQSDARPATIAGRRLGEELEDDLVKLGWDSTTGVLHLDLQPGAGRMAGWQIIRSLERAANMYDAAGTRELECVVHQIL